MSLAVQKVPRASSRRPLLPDAVVATLLVVATEVMLFAGFISAFVILKAGSVAWPPPGQPRLPVLVTAFNTLLLLASGGALSAAGRPRGSIAALRVRWAVAAALLGTAFVAIQGLEWVRLIAYGLTMRSSSYGAFFYLIVGTHALHAVAGVVALLWAARGLAREQVTPAAFEAVRIFWYFVVLVWPVLYVTVYLA